MSDNEDDKLFRRSTWTSEARAGPASLTVSPHECHAFRVRLTLPVQLAHQCSALRLGLTQPSHQAHVRVAYQKGLTLPSQLPQEFAAVQTGLTPGTARAQEDAQLVELVEQYGPMNWSVIAQQLRSTPPRNGKSCRLRWCGSALFLVLRPCACSSGCWV